MAGTSEGGRKAAQKLLEKNPNHYAEIAHKAQEAWRNNGRRPRGFASDPQRASRAGKVGGLVSKRGKSADNQDLSPVSQEDRES